jgi:hypothetical protein
MFFPGDEGEGSARNKGNSKTLQGRLKAQLKATALRFQPSSIVGALETPSRVKMNAASAAPLTAFPARCPRLSFLRLTPAVVVIDRMTERRGNALAKEFACAFVDLLRKLKVNEDYSTHPAAQKRGASDISFIHNRPQLSSSIHNRLVG